MNWFGFKIQRTLTRELAEVREAERLRKDINWKSAKLLMELGYVWCCAQEEWVSEREALFYKEIA